MSETYFLKKIPQSEYRRGTPSTRDAGDSYIDLSLSPLKIKTPKLKEALIQKIAEAAQQMAKVLLPEEKQIDAITKDDLNDIYTRLGLR